MKNIKPIGSVVLGALLLGLIPFVSDSEKSYLVYFLFLTFCHIVLTQGWNLVAGYTGQISLGTPFRPWCLYNCDDLASGSFHLGVTTTSTPLQ